VKIIKEVSEKGRGKGKNKPKSPPFPCLPTTYQICLLRKQKKKATKSHSIEAGISSTIMQNPDMEKRFKEPKTQGGQRKEEDKQGGRIHQQIKRQFPLKNFLYALDLTPTFVMY